MRRWGKTLAVGFLLALAAAPFVGFFPEPPAFGRGAAAILAVAVTLATVGSAFHASPIRRERIIKRTAILLGITIVSIVVRIVLARTLAREIPTLDILPRNLRSAG